MVRTDRSLATTSSSRGGCDGRVFLVWRLFGGGCPRGWLGRGGPEPERHGSAAAALLTETPADGDETLARIAADPRLSRLHWLARQAVMVCEYGLFLSFVEGIGSAREVIREGGEAAPDFGRQVLAHGSMVSNLLHRRGRAGAHRESIPRKRALARLEGG